jgi:23S rRNA pseudouridine1911/1915/1917 synthase
MSKFANQTIEYIIQIEDQGLRLDKFLANKLTEISRTKIKKLIESNNLQINGLKIDDPSRLLKANDVLKLFFPNSEEATLKPKNIPLKVVYEDEYLIIIDKPAGLTVHPGAGNFQDTLVNALIHHFGSKLSKIGGEARPGIIHRLDKDTSGLIIIAKDDITHAKLAKVLAAREIKRVYLALVYGSFTVKTGKIEANIGRSEINRKQMRVVRERGKVAITQYKVLKEFGNGALSLLECELETGRTHQIRVHLTYKKHPLVGDQTYGVSLNHNLQSFPEEVKATIRQFPRQALHAAYLEFVHPIDGQKLYFESEIPSDMNDLLEMLK